MKHYDAMLAEAFRLGWPERFQTDLTRHDRGWLSTYPDETPVFWVLWSDGTYIAEIGREPIDGVGHRVWDCPRFFWPEMRARFYTWDGAALRFHDVGVDAMTQILREMADARHARETVRPGDCGDCPECGSLSPWRCGCPASESVVLP